MCGAPKIDEPEKYQSAKAPVFNTSSQNRAKTGRQGTILSSGTAGQSYAPDGKRTLLGG